jgi:Tfp pilus assembly protein FimT
MLELMIVIMLISLVMAVSFPKMGETLRRQGVRGARDAIVAMHATARAAAVQRGRETELRFSNNRVFIVSRHPVSNVVDTIGTVQDLMAAYRTTIRASDSIFTFDARGVGQETATTTIRIARDNIVDGVRITRWGLIR